MDQEHLFLPVAQAYDRWSSFYDTYDNPMVFMASQIVARALPGLAGMSVFEFGCGTGRNLAALHACGARELAGCDLSDGMLNVARARLPQARLFAHDMTCPLPIAGGSVDRALFCLTLEHIADLRFPLQEAKRILRPEGRIGIVEIHPYYSLTGVAAHFEQDGIDVRMPTHAHQFQHYLAAFAELGLRVALCREWRPIDVGNPLPLQKLRRGAHVPLTLEFWLEKEERPNPAQ